MSSCVHFLSGTHPLVATLVNLDKYDYAACFFNSMNMLKFCVRPQESGLIVTWPVSDTASSY
jgi:hypothetical protein